MTNQFKMIADIISENKAISLKDTKISKDDLIKLTVSEIAQEDDRLRLDELKEVVKGSINKYRGLNMVDIRLQIDKKSSKYRKIGG